MSTGSEISMEVARSPVLGGKSYLPNAAERLRTLTIRASEGDIIGIRRPSALTRFATMLSIISLRVLYESVDELIK